LSYSIADAQSSAVQSPPLRLGDTGTAAPLLDVRDLRLVFDTYRGTVDALEGVTFSAMAGEAVGIIGETGCGKSATARAVMGFIDPPARVVGGEIFLDGRNVLAMSAAELREMRGRLASFVFQEAKKALNPTATVGSQLIEAAQCALGVSKSEARKAAAAALSNVGLADAERIMKSYSYELSGAMAQRVMIAIAMVGGAKLIVADEPTSALDVSIQAQILKLLGEIRRRTGSAFLLITHDLGVAAENCDSVNVMYAGRVVESGPAATVFARPAHPYTARLLAALPTPGRDRLEAIPGTVPDLVAPPSGCRFSNRCDRATALCSERPADVEVEPGHRVACHYPLTRSRIADLEGEAA
jgi:oligopeptide/dipeptide ABC transporter ATP-binding protein